MSWEWGTVKGQPPSSLTVSFPWTSTLLMPIFLLQALEATGQATSPPGLPYTLATSIGIWSPSSTIWWSPVQGIYAMFLAWKGCFHSPSLIKTLSHSITLGRERYALSTIWSLEPHTPNKLYNLPCLEQTNHPEGSWNSLFSLPQILALRPPWLFRDS